MLELGVSFSAAPTVFLTVFYTLNGSACKCVHQHLFNAWETALDLKAALLSALRRLRRELESHLKRYGGDMHGSLKPKWLDSEVSHPKLSLVQTFLKSWNNRQYLLYKIPAKGSILSSYESNPRVLWETKGNVLTEGISPLSFFCWIKVNFWKTGDNGERIQIAVLPLICRAWKQILLPNTRN